MLQGCVVTFLEIGCLRSHVFFGNNGPIIWNHISGFSGLFHDIGHNGTCLTDNSGIHMII